MYEICFRPTRLNFVEKSLGVSLQTTSKFHRIQIIVMNLMFEQCWI